MANRKKRTRRDWIQPAQSNPILQPGETLVENDDLPDHLKLSAKLLQIMDPWIDEMDITTLANCASIAWNACVDDDDNCSSYDYLTGSIDSRTEHKDLLNQLKTRKKKMFPNDLRTIVRMQVQLVENGDPKLVVASTLKPENMKRAFDRFLTKLSSDTDDDR